MAFPLQHQTQAQFTARVRARYDGAVGDEAARLAAWIMDALDAGDFTDAELRQAWGKTVAEWAQVKGRMQSSRQSWRAVQAARGE